mmetsp:Transcript_4461/g.6615  ORF Transcript_4461/g.6615 Transcript_4461/m.6615 type:complete len:167 (+) Transcript_4461:5033-5533(+)
MPDSTMPIMADTSGHQPLAIQETSGHLISSGSGNRMPSEESEDTLLKRRLLESEQELAHIQNLRKIEEEKLKIYQLNQQLEAQKSKPAMEETLALDQISFKNEIQQNYGEAVEPGEYFARNISGILVPKDEDHKERSFTNSDNEPSPEEEEEQKKPENLYYSVGRT